MESLDVNVLTQGISWVVSQPIWLCTVITTCGSSPRPPGAMRVISSDGQYHGSLSGGGY
ncbi:XdhC family protein [Rosenbergiella nectarea]|uniref:XdhC family protein n=1 Tax=Rosenbergiella nectarea TaxID=988801 RepID=UPI001E65C130|nr:XdhC family protein [Rosenbergiella nectarea]